MAGCPSGGPREPDESAGLPSEKLQRCLDYKLNHRFVQKNEPHIAQCASRKERCVMGIIDSRERAMQRLHGGFGSYRIDLLPAHTGAVGSARGYVGTWRAGGSRPSSRLHCSRSCSVA